MNEAKLKPCPFCGSTDLRFEQYVGVCVTCNHCGVSGACCEDEDEAVENWNRRANTKKSEITVRPIQQCQHCLSSHIIYKVIQTIKDEIKVQAECVDCGRRSFLPHLENLAKRQNSTLAHWREQVVKRDGKKCVICGSTERLEVHHIIPVSHDPARKYMYSPENGITLCHNCHALVHHDNPELLDK